MRVTFDTNVWEKLVSGEYKFSWLKDQIEKGEIEPYICEIALSLESIRRKDRLIFWRTYEHKIDFIDLPSEGNSVHSRVCFSPNNEAHPGIHPTQRRCLNLAKELGFRILPMTNIGTVRCAEIPEEMFIHFDSIEVFWVYAENLEKCSSYIQSLECGSFAYFKLKKELGLSEKVVKHGDLEHVVKAYQEKHFQKAIAEWVDGDAVSAHYAYGNSVFCTEDCARNAGRKSIFHQQNIDQIIERFDLKVLTVSELKKL